MEKIKEKIYIFPGIANSIEIMEKIDLGKEKMIIEYPEYNLKDNQEEYLKKIAKGIEDENPVFVGFSLGGIIALRTAKYKKPKLIFLVSSIKHTSESSLFVRIIARLKLSKKILTPLAIFFAGLTGKNKKIIRNRVRNGDQNFLNLLYGFFDLSSLNYENLKIIRIHGKKDKLFPIKKISNIDYILPGGHFLLDSYPKDLSKIIKNFL